MVNSVLPWPQRALLTWVCTFTAVSAESPAFDLHHPEIAALEYEDNDALVHSGAPADAPDMEGRAEMLGEEDDRR